MSSSGRASMSLRDQRAGVRHAIVLAGGKGLRLGGRSKADLRMGEHSLLDRVLHGIAPVVAGHVVVVAPDSVSVPDGVHRVMEDPPGGGPLAGIGAGVDLLAGKGVLDGEVVVCAVDTPGIGGLAPRLCRALEADPSAEGALAVGGGSERFRQHLQAVYDLAALRAVLAGSGPLRDRGVKRILDRLRLVEVLACDTESRDLDTPEDLRWWTARAAERSPSRSGPMRNRRRVTTGGSEWT